MTETAKERTQLKNVKYFAAMSEETHCFTASLYFDGKKIGIVKNQGHGGCDDVYPDEGKREIVAAWKKICSLEKTTITLPSDFNATSTTEMEMDSTAEIVIGDLMNEWHEAQEAKLNESWLKRQHKKGAVCIRHTNAPDTWRTFGDKRWSRNEIIAGLEERFGSDILEIR